MIQKQQFLNGRYEVMLLNKRIDLYNNRDTFDVYIKNVHDNTSVVINTYKPSPFLTTNKDKISDALNFIVSMAIEYKDDNRYSTDEPEFKNIYEQLHTVIPDDDIDNLYYGFINMENDS